MHNFTFTSLAKLAAWTSLGVFAYLTLAHVGLIYSIYFKLAPFLLNVGMKRYAVFEHFLAFSIFGTLFCCAYPKQVLMVCLVVFGGAIVLELMQTLTQDRHGTILDALEKMAGGAFGIFTSKIALDLWGNRQPRTATRASPDRS